MLVAHNGLITPLALTTEVITVNIMPLMTI